MVTVMDARTMMSCDLEEAVQRARAEYLEMPGLQLTVPQAARLWHLDLASSEGVLFRLVQSRFLVKNRHDAYARS
jgi:hypothetical protein